MDSSDCLTGWILYGLTAPARYGTDTDPATHHGLIPTTRSVPKYHGSSLSAHSGSFFEVTTDWYLQ